MPDKKKPLSIDEYVAQVVAKAPPLSEAQRVRLAAIFGSVPIAESREALEAA